MSFHCHCNKPHNIPPRARARAPRCNPARRCWQSSRRTRFSGPPPPTLPIATTFSDHNRSSPNTNGDGGILYACRSVIRTVEISKNLSPRPLRPHDRRVPHTRTTLIPVYTIILYTIHLHGTDPRSLNSLANTSTRPLPFRHEIVFYVCVCACESDY